MVGPFGRLAPPLARVGSGTSVRSTKKETVRGSELAVESPFGPKVAPFVECSSKNRRQLPVCKEQDIESYPTWVINGKKCLGCPSGSLPSLILQEPSSSFFWG